MYAKGKGAKDVALAYSSLTSNIYYQDFIQQVTVDGTWDDHDYGVNDGGRWVGEKLDRALQFMNFLNYGRTVAHRRSQMSARIAEREGVYHSRTVRGADGGVAKFLFLDTRYMRDHHYVRSLGEIKLPLTALIAAAYRTLYSLLGFGRNYEGDVLGEKQWAWLEAELGLAALSNKTVDFHVVVSSIQVFTSNPAVESWGHFPEAKRRLIEVFRRCSPSGLAILSGDVHHAETITVPTGSKTAPWFEVTSSGITHSAADGLVNSLLCPLMLETFSRHRRSDYGDAVYVGKNFGKIQFNQRVMNVSIHDVESGLAVLERVVKSSSRTFGNPKANIPGPIETVDFPTLQPLYVVVTTLVVGLSILWFVSRNRKTKKSASSSTNRVGSVVER